VARSAFVGALNDIFVIGAIVAFGGAVVAVVTVQANDFHRQEGPVATGQPAEAAA
jgi:hypothetical protein